MNQEIAGTDSDSSSIESLGQILFLIEKIINSIINQAVYPF